MILIADIGSTKGDWALAPRKKGRAAYFQSPGISPVYQPEETIRGHIARLLEQNSTWKDVEAVFYYGTGCFHSDRRLMMQDILKDFFPGAPQIEIHHDLLGAARALCKDRKGIAGILGTGSNSCLYDGEKVVDQIPNLGYLAGDEGSGTHIGKEILRAYFYREFPKELEQAFQKRYSPELDAVIREMYAGKANRFLSSFTHFARENLHHPAMSDLVERVFDEFFRRHVFKYRGFACQAIHFTGSVAYYFKSILQELMIKYDLRPGTIIKEPIKELVVYHQKFT